MDRQTMDRESMKKVFLYGMAGAIVMLASLISDTMGIKSADRIFAAIAIVLLIFMIQTIITGIKKSPQ